MVPCFLHLWHAMAGDDKVIIRHTFRDVAANILFLFFSSFLYSSSLSLLENSRRLNWVRHSSHKSSATHSCHCVQCFRESKQWNVCQCLGFLTYAQMLMHDDTVRESALEADSERNIPCRTADSNPRQYCAWLFSTS